MSETEIDKKKIESLLPHREPMLLIDKLINIVPLKSATAIMHVKKDGFYVYGKDVATRGKIHDDNDNHYYNDDGGSDGDDDEDGRATTMTTMTTMTTTMKIEAEI